MGISEREILRSVHQYLIYSATIAQLRMLFCTPHQKHDTGNNKRYG